MHKKISAGLTVALIIVTLIITAMITTAVTMNVYSSLISDLPRREEMYDKLSEADDLIRNNYLGEIEEESVNGGIISGYLGALSQGDNIYMTPEEYKSYKTEKSGINPEDGSPVKTVSYQEYGSCGYIKITGFNDNTPSQFKEACDSAAANSAQALIIDVRNTQSENIKAAAEIIDIIVPLASEGTQAIAAAEDKNGNSLQVFSADSASIDLPVSVLVNEKTSGAGELIACDMRDFGKGAVVGQTTAGNGAYQKIFELTDGSAVLLTVGKIIPYTSDCYDGVGVVPDYTVNMTGEASELKNDGQFLQAYAVVTAQK